MNKPLRVLIVDDEPLARQRLAAWVEDSADLELIGECGNGDDAIAFIRRYQPDLALLDVRMPGRDGLDVVRQIEPDNMPLVIFQTAYSDHAVRAFELQALDYLLKPVARERFDQAIERALTSHRLHQASEQRQQLANLLTELQRRGTYRERLFVKTGSKLEPVRIDQIDWIGAAGNYVELHCGERTFLIRSTLNAFAEELDPARFVRIHRSTIVALDRIRELEPKGNGDFLVVLTSGARLVLSRTYRAELEAHGPFA